MNRRYSAERLFAPVYKVFCVVVVLGEEREDSKFFPGCGWCSRYS